MLAVDPGTVVAGEVVAEAGLALPRGPLRVLVTALQSSSAATGTDEGLVREDGRFSRRGPSGPILIAVSPLPPGWAIKAVEIGGEDFAGRPLDLRPGARVEGVTITLTNRFPSLAGGLVDEDGPTLDGTVAYIEGRDPVRGMQVASVRLSVQGADVTGIALKPLTPSTLRGRVVTDDGQPLPGTPRILVTAESLAPGGVPALPTSPGANGLVAADGTFTFGSARPGPTLLRVSPLPPGWSVRSVTIGGRDPTEVPFELPDGLAIGNIRIVLSRTLPSLSGRVVDASGQPARGAVLLFPIDPARWHEGAVHLVRPDRRGDFRIPALRPGEYFALALEYVQTWQATDPEFLDGLRRRAVKVRVVEGANDRLELRVH